MDMITQMRLHHVSCTVLFERVCWYYPIHYDIISYEATNMMYHQATQLYLDGWLITIPDVGARMPSRLLVRILCLTFHRSLLIMLNIINLSKSCLFIIT